MRTTMQFWTTSIVSAILLSTCAICMPTTPESSMNQHRIDFPEDPIVLSPRFGSNDAPVDPRDNPPFDASCRQLSADTFVSKTTPVETFPTSGELTLALLPSLPQAQVVLTTTTKLYKFSILGSGVELKKCSKEPLECKAVDYAARAKMPDLLMVNEWNILSIKIEASDVTLTVNGDKKVSSFNEEEVMDGQVEWQVSAEDIIIEDQPIYTVMVQIQCVTSTTSTTSKALEISTTDAAVIEEEVTEVSPVIDAELSSSISPDDETSENITDIEATTESLHGGAEPQKGGSEEEDHTMTYIIVVAVLGGILLVIVIAIVTHLAMRKRKSLEISQHTPLKEQQ